MLYVSWDQEGSIYFGSVREDSNMNHAHGSLVEHIYIHIDNCWVELHTLYCVMNIYSSIMNLKSLWME